MYRGSNILCYAQKVCKGQWRKERIKRWPPSVLVIMHRGDKVSRFDGTAGIGHGRCTLWRHGDWAVVDELRIFP